MENKKCGGPADTPDQQESLGTTVRTEDGCEEAHVNMGTGEVTYTPAQKGKCGCNGDGKEEK